jgi:hypothetical protein
MAVDYDVLKTTQLISELITWFNGIVVIYHCYNIKTACSVVDINDTYFQI